MASRALLLRRALQPLIARRQQLHTATALRSELQSRTGQTGAAVLGLGALGYLLSKEIVVLHSETVVVAAVGGVTYGLVKQFGPEVAGALDSYSKEIEEAWNKSRNAELTRLKEEIAEQETIKKSLTAVPAIYDIQAEINDMERELSYRQSLDNAYNAVFRELNEVVAIEGQQRLAAQQETVAWLEREVIKALAGKEDALMKQAISDLDALATKAAKAR